MTRQDPAARSAHQSDASDRVSETQAGRTPPRVKRPLILFFSCGFGVFAVYVIAVCTPFGQRAENALIDRGGLQNGAWIYEWSGSVYGSVAMPPLNDTAMPTLFAGIAVIVAVTLVRRCWWQGCAAIGSVLVTVAGSEALGKVVLPRPDLVDARAGLVEASFPSGHVAVPAALALGLALVVSPRIRPFVIAAGMLWLAVTAGAVQALYHHRPSDVLGATLLACACFGISAWLLPPSAAPGVTRSPRVLPGVALAMSAAGALVAGARDDSFTGSLIFAAAAFLCATLLWYTAAQRPAPNIGTAEGSIDA